MSGRPTRCSPSRPWRWAASAWPAAAAGWSGAAIGAIDIFLLQSALTFFNVSTFVLQIAYGAILVAGRDADRACRNAVASAEGAA